MRTFAYCAQDFEQGTRKAVGVVPVTCPPVCYQEFKPALLEGHEFLYFDFHGDPGQSAWYSLISSPMGPSIKQVALIAEQLLQANLGGAVVFATTCYLGDMDSPMMDALLRAGASYVVGGAGPNLASTSRRTVGASELGRLFRLSLSRGLPAPKALQVAKAGMTITTVLRRNDRQAFVDSLQFRAYTV